MKQTEVNAEEFKTIEVMLNKKAPKSSMRERTKLLLITGGILTAIAAPITVAAVLITKTKSDKESTQQKYDDLLKAHTKDIQSVMAALDANRTSWSILDKLRQNLIAFNTKLDVAHNLDATLSKQFTDSFSLIKSSQDQLKIEEAKLRTELAELHRVIAAAHDNIQNVFDIYLK